MAALVDSLATTDALAAAFSDPALLQALIHVEIALARAQARVGVIPPDAARAIASAASASDFDAAQLARDARASGTVVIPFVKALTARVQARDPDAAGFVHWGATSQDVADTAFVMCLSTANDIVMADAARLSSALRRHGHEHASTVMLGRTLLQPGPPITLGLKIAGWYAAVERGRDRLESAAKDACVLQFGGAVGTLASLGDRGMDVARALAEELSLPWPGAPWHAHRDRLAAYVGACGIFTATLGKIARDLSLLMQAEVDEVVEPGGGSSTMPHKRNPSSCAIVLAAATRVPGLVASLLTGLIQEHERSVGGWHAEWPTIASAVQATGSATLALADAVEQLDVHADRMRANVAATRGLVFAERVMMRLAPVLGRDRAHEVLNRAVAESRRTGADLPATLAAMHEVTTAIPTAELAGLFAPEGYLGVADAFRRALLGEQ